MQRVVTRRAGDGRERAKVGSSPFRQFIDGREMFPCKSEIARPRPARNSCGEAVATLCSTPRACFRRAANSIEVGRRGARRKSCIQKRSELNHITGSTHGSWLAPRECHFAQADQTAIAYPLNGTPNVRTGDRLRLGRPYSVNVARQRPVTAPILHFCIVEGQVTCLPVPAALVFQSRFQRVSAIALVVHRNGPKPAILRSRSANVPAASLPCGIAPPRDVRDEAPKVRRWRRRGRHDERRVAMSGRSPGRIEAAFQNATAGAGRAARSGQCQNTNPIRVTSAASAIGHGSSAWGTSGFRSSGVRRLTPRARSPIRTGRESAGRPFNIRRDHVEIPKGARPPCPQPILQGVVT